MGKRLGIDCGSVSLNLVLLDDKSEEPVTIYRRTMGRPLETLISAIDDLMEVMGGDLPLQSALVTGSAREFLQEALEIPAINEITAHATGVHQQDPRVRTVIEIGGQDSKFIKLEPAGSDNTVRIQSFRMNEICAAGTGAFLDEQADRLGIPVESFGPTALQSRRPTPIAGRCAVFAKTDMIHKAQDGTPLPDLLLGLAFALVRNYMATLVRGDSMEPVVSLQGGVMMNQAVVQAFHSILDLSEDQITIPQHFTVLGALGCAILANRGEPISELNLEILRKRAVRALEVPVSRSFLPPLNVDRITEVPLKEKIDDTKEPRQPLIMGLDVGSVSVKGVLIDATGRIVKEDYRLSRSRPLEIMEEVLKSITSDREIPKIISVTGSGRHLTGSLLDAEMIVNEISAQAEAALSFDCDVDTVVEIGGQDSKWISLENGVPKDFEMNRVCAAGTGSFLMEQGERLNLSMGKVFSDAAFTSRAPADLGTRCTVFMESDLIHHQNTGASTEDLAAGVCISIVQNYLERVANRKPLGKKVLFLGGVAATLAVRAAFQHQTGINLHIPDFFRVSGALGAALKALDAFTAGDLIPKKRDVLNYNLKRIPKDQFTCQGCTNNCLIDKYRPGKRIVYRGGLCDRWEGEHGKTTAAGRYDPFHSRARLLKTLSEQKTEGSVSFGMIRSPQFYEWFPFWKAFCRELGISLVLPPPPDRRQFEKGSRFLKVETCLPIKVMAGQIADLVDSGVKTLLHPSILSEPPISADGKPQTYCPYIQASAQFFKGSFDLEWKEPIISHELDADSFRKEPVRFAGELGIRTKKAEEALKAGLKELALFNEKLRLEGSQFLNSLGEHEQAVVVLGKPYHNSDSFLNMNLGSLFHRLGIPAVPADLLPMHLQGEQPEVSWKHQGNMIRIAREIAGDSRLFPVLITFFGCGPDPFTLRHIEDSLGGKPLLVLEMDELTSRAGIFTRIEAFLERIKSSKRVCLEGIGQQDADRSVLEGFQEKSVQPKSSPSVKGPGRAEEIFVPFMGDQSYGFAAAAQCMGIEAKVLPPPDQESDLLGRRHMVGGECFPYALILGDYLKLAQNKPSQSAERSVFYIIGVDACRLSQYPIYMEKVRQHLGFTISVVSEPEQVFDSFGLSPNNTGRALLKVWEGLNAFDLLSSLYFRIRPLVRDRTLLDTAYREGRDKLFQALSTDRVHEGMEEALHELYLVPTDETVSRPVVSVTGDYYTRVVPFANNDVYGSVENLGGLLWAPPSFADSFKIGAMKDLVWNLLNRRSREAAHSTLLYLFMLISEFKVKRGPGARRVYNSPMDLLGLNMWKAAARHTDIRLPGGITAPIATTMRDLEMGANGVLNLITLNCAYGTVVTVALTRALKEGPGVPMLTLIYEGLKKTNETSRVEAFMDQVHNHFRRKTA
jgi:predicted CoA-substrate-specific enzyme activase